MTYLPVGPRCRRCAALRVRSPEGACTLRVALHRTISRAPHRHCRGLARPLVATGSRTS